MNFIEKLQKISGENNSRLCVGLDPADTHDLFEFNKRIIDETSEFVCAYKPNIAFFEANGIVGLEALLETIEYIPDEIPVILDAKRGDIGHTAAAYAKGIFEEFGADATTLNPYLGYDSIKPFADYKDKFSFVLCLTSNPSNKDFQKGIYLEVAKKVVEWNINENLGLVVGATNPDQLKEIRAVAKDLLFLIPGVGAQGGDLKKTVKAGGKNIIINASRSIINSEDPAEEAKKLRNEINSFC